MNRCVALARELVRCDTQNPPGREAPVVPLLVDLLSGLGCEVEVVTTGPGRESVLARYGTGKRPTLLVNGHLDVVPVAEEDWSVPPFAGVVRDGRLIGRGAADMKGGIAAAIEGFRACLDAGTLGTDVVFHLVADEETGGRLGTQALLESGRIEADACVVPEPTELRVAVAERGTFQARIEVSGIAGHGGEPGRARSAIADAAAVVQSLHLADFGDTHPLLGSPTCNVALIEGGSAANVVAARCVLTIDRRTLPGQTQADIVAALEARIPAGIDYRIEPLFFAEASEIAPGHAFVDFALDCCGETEPVGLSLGTDARFLRNQLGIPSVVFGPGSMRQAHTADEWVSIEELAAAARCFERMFTPPQGHPMFT
ncbi:M20 family metallopeptidase [Amycolatopsis jejuensis]|uniref:M20 family metallopeptidase n=1 Tax=Amycolatopsis jejuensis TaxID=330084 RepID=UPI00052530CC|nr:M20 family metallopeptidase [Amycolatopsis jejuensis]